MSKIKLMIIIFVVCSISLIGCGRDSFFEDKPAEGSNNDKYVDDKSEETPLGEESDEAGELEQLEQLEGVWLETEYQSYEVGVMSVRVKWYNSLDDDMIFGEFFELEENINGSWEKVSKETDVNYGFNAIGYGLVSNESRWHTYNLIPYTDGLSPGEYRISTSFMRETLDGK